MRVFATTRLSSNASVNEAGTDAVLQCDQATEIILSGIAFARADFIVLPPPARGQDHRDQYRQLKSLRSPI